MAKLHSTHYIDVLAFWWMGDKTVRSTWWKSQDEARDGVQEELDQDASASDQSEEQITM